MVHCYIGYLNLGEPLAYELFGKVRLRSVRLHMLNAPVSL